MIDLKVRRLLPDPYQNNNEWLAFLIFCESYFKTYGIEHPLVVELGIWDNHQRSFYKTFLGAEHIGIDISTEHAEPDIVGDSHDGATLDKLKAKIGGRNVDLLFIDADHSYEAVKLDYEMYNPLVSRGLIAFHDLVSYGGSVGKLWKEIIDMHRTDQTVTFLEFKAWSSPTYMPGIGVMIRA